MQSSGTSDEGMERNVNYSHFVLLLLCYINDHFWFPLCTLALVSRKDLYINDHFWFPLCTIYFWFTHLFFVRWFPLCMSWKDHYLMFHLWLIPTFLEVSCLISGLDFVLIRFVSCKDHSIIFHLWFTLCTNQFCVPKRSSYQRSLLVYNWYPSVWRHENFNIQTAIKATMNIEWNCVIFV